MFETATEHWTQWIARKSHKTHFHSPVSRSSYQPKTNTPGLYDGSAQARAILGPTFEGDITQEGADIRRHALDYLKGLRLPPDEYRALCRWVMDRDGWRCRRCGYRQALHCHHIIYRSDMGEDVSWNLITLCSDCHKRVHAYALSILVAEGNFVGEGGGADGKILFFEEK